MSRNGPKSPSDPERGPDDFAPAKLEPGMRREFLLQVGMLNAGVLAAGAGLVLLTFTDTVTGGIVLTGTGLCLLAVALWRYDREAPAT